jgi:hypothetical protein
MNEYIDYIWLAKRIDELERELFIIKMIIKELRPLLIKN